MTELNIAHIVERPPMRLYEVRTVHGESYWAEGDVIESGGGWFTLWADELTIALRVPEADVRAVRHISEDEQEAQAGDVRESQPEQERQHLVDALERVRREPETPEIMNSNQPNAGDWLAGYTAGVRAAKRAARPRADEAATS